jgi:hypothetical protein
LRHRRAVDKDRNDRNIALERRLNLDANEIAGVIEAAPVLTVGAGNPVLPDHGNKRVAFANAVGKDVNEVKTGRDRVDVEKTFSRPRLLVRRSKIRPAKPPESSRR